MKKKTNLTRGELFQRIEEMLSFRLKSIKAEVREELETREQRAAKRAELATKDGLKTRRLAKTKYAGCIGRWNCLKHCWNKLTRTCVYNLDPFSMGMVVLSYYKLVDLFRQIPYKSFQDFMGFFFNVTFLMLFSVTVLNCATFSFMVDSIVVVPSLIWFLDLTL